MTFKYSKQKKTKNEIFLLNLSLSKFIYVSHTKHNDLMMTCLFYLLQVPGRPTAAELKAMALRQQQQIDTQHQVC